MALVDYSSDDGQEDDQQDDQTSTARTQPPPPPPPLPRAFHDLYAATVRTAPADLPSLHHGRRRAIPHVAGQWPSHLYIEWIPSATEHDRLDALLAAVCGRLDDDDDHRVHSLLTSDLGVPLTLHISLSRPFVLATAGKATFLQQLVAEIKTAGVGAFAVVLSDPVWFRSPDSARSFLVLRADVEDSVDNGPLIKLLDRCNAHVVAAGQPALYAGGSASAAASFHVSVAWTLADTDTDTWHDATRDAYELWKGGGNGNDAAATTDPLRIRVDSIKAKIGNVVTDVPLGKTAASLLPAAKRGCKRVREEDDARGESEAKSNKSDSNKSNDTRHKGKSLFGL